MKEEVINKNIPGFRNVPRTGVIYVMHRAAEMGYKTGDPAWVNLGQGAPEVTNFPGASERLNQLTIDIEQHEYAPVAGHRALCQKIADLYNNLYRKDKRSLYTWENVSISGGGRIGLTRLVGSLANINIGHFLPDYTAYEELLSIFNSFVPIPILLDAQFNYHISIEQIKKEIVGRGLQALLLSNPCNPTGQVIKDDILRQWVEMARDTHCSIIFDEFYSHYIYDKMANHAVPKTVSAAEYIDDVDRDPIIIVDGLTKNWRYPGWRVSWTLGPKEVIRTIANAGSFLDGGASHPFQNAILPLLEPTYVRQEAIALQSCFQQKRDYMLKRLETMGIRVEAKPQGTFYVWANLSQLPDSIRDGMAFFEAGLTEKVITVPGVFFDVNPEKRRSHAQYNQYARISFGPSQQTLELGLDALERVIKKSK
jgi:aspartate/methionine/tyrosine aminotransferase